MNSYRRHIAPLEVRHYTNRSYSYVISNQFFLSLTIKHLVRPAILPTRMYGMDCGDASPCINKLCFFSSLRSVCVSSLWASHYVIERCCHGVARPPMAIPRRAESGALGYLRPRSDYLAFVYVEKNVSYSSAFVQRSPYAPIGGFAGPLRNIYLVSVIPWFFWFGDVQSEAIVRVYRDLVVTRGKGREEDRRSSLGEEKAGTYVRIEAIKG